MSKILFFTKITPVYIFCAVGILYGLYTLLPLFTKPKGTAGDVSIGYPFILMGILLLLLIGLGERLLAPRMPFLPLFIIEFFVLIFLVVAGLYWSRKTEINIRTQSGYFFIQYDSTGLAKKSFKRKYLFSRERVFENERSIHLHSELLYNNSVQLEVKGPPAWENGYSSKGLDTTVAGRKISLFIYADPSLKANIDSLLKEKATQLSQ